jgi:hypothetical protein
MPWKTLLSGIHQPVEAKAVFEAERRGHNQVRPHSTRDYRPPAPRAMLPALPIWDTETEQAAS